MLRMLPEVVLLRTGAALGVILCAALSARAADTAADDGARTAVPARWTAARLDRLVVAELAERRVAEPVDDATFLRRVTLDMLGRLPSTDETAALASDESPGRRDAVIDRLLADASLGRNWGNYFSDVISYRIPQPELTFLDYKSFKRWLAERINRNDPWNEVVAALITADGKVKDNPAATFVGFQQANPVRLAGETSRVFLGVQVHCAECHDHPFEHWEREQFHGMAAFYVRSSAKLPWRDSDEVVVGSKPKGEYRMPDMHDPRKTGTVVAPTTLDGTRLAPGRSDRQRRAELAAWVTSPKNPWFARAQVNRFWARLAGSGFYEPVDNMADTAGPRLPKVHAALAEHFVATGYDVKSLLRLIAGTAYYQRGFDESNRAAPANPLESANDADSARPMKLGADQVFDALAGAVQLENVTPPAVKHDDNFRFPPPPKSTRDRLAEAFGFDPSVPRDQVERTMQQAMWMMNHKQLQAEIDADPKSGTMLAKLLADTKDDRAALAALYERVLARRPADREIEIATEHIAGAASRGEAFEDILWSLVNSAEFTVKR